MCVYILHTQAESVYVHFEEKRGTSEVFMESEMFILKDTGQIYKYKVKKIVKGLSNNLGEQSHLVFY